MKIIDISWPITPDITGYKNAQDAQFSATHNFEQHAMRKSRILLSAHAGTHVNAPAHCIHNGKTIDQLEVDQLIGPCAVLDFTYSQSAITREDLEQFELSKGLILLLKTTNSELLENAPFDPHFIYLEAEAARYCVELGVKAIGIDYLSIERSQEAYATHTILFNGNIALIEGLRLAHVAQGFYFFICLPLALIGLEAAPARAILIEDLV